MQCTVHENLFSAPWSRGGKQGEAMRPDSPEDLLLDVPSGHDFACILHPFLGCHHSESVSKKLIKNCFLLCGMTFFFKTRVVSQILSYFLPLVTIGLNFGKLRSVVVICTQDLWTSLRCWAMSSNQVAPDQD